VYFYPAAAGGSLRRSYISLSLGLYLLGLGNAGATIGVAYQMLLGNPSNTTADTNNHNHFLIQREVEALDYSDTLRQPNWASWHLSAADLGSSGRSDAFAGDTNLPSNFYWVKAGDYSGSGYDRGHMCPSADRTDTTNHNKETFLMSNMVPQAPDNNRGIWADLESYCRTLAHASNEVLITCGPEGFSGARTDSAGLIYIPSNVWKIIVVVPPGPGTALERISAMTRVIAVNIPNINGIYSDPWQSYLTSVNHLQTNTGFTFFSALDHDLAAVLRAKVDGTSATDLASFTPVAGPVNASVVITGTNLAGATAVKFNGVSATFTQDSATQLTAFVPTNATSGPLSVIASGGLATSSTSFGVTTSQPVPVTLTITSSGNYLFIYWPASATGYSLEQNPDLNPTNWTAYTGPLVTGTNYVVTLTAPTGQRFFRLVHP
jgi:DNA/RNA endonuclease G (NUC1)